MIHMSELEALSPWVAAFGVAPDTCIETETGERVASDLAIGDLVRTADGAMVPIKDLRHTVAAPAERNHYPIWIGQGALGFGLPRRDLELGPQHRVLIRSFRVQLMLGEDAVLARAKSLSASFESIAVRRAVTPASYVQIILEKQALILAEGLPVESILPEGECDLPFTTVRSWELLAAVA